MTAKLAAGAWLALAGLWAAPVEKAISASVSLVSGPVNSVIIRRNGASLAIYGDPRPKPEKVERVLFTHHRRDVAWAGRAQVAAGAAATAPAVEEALFTGVRAFWTAQPTTRFKDLSMQSSRVLDEPIPVAAKVKGGDKFTWQGIEFSVLDTPGYTRGAVTYLFLADGKRFACTGDLIYGDGKLMDLFSLQDAIPEAKEDAYHGWATRAGETLRSLNAIAAWKPDVLLPAHGPPIDQPGAAIERLTARLQAVFRSHFDIDALRWYRGDESIRKQAGKVLGSQTVEWMPQVETTKLPDWIVPIGNSRLIVSKDGPGFLVDCGSPRLLEQVKATGRKVEGIWVTHYHSDHTGAVAQAAKELKAPVYATNELREILEFPARYKMPVMTANAIVPVEGQVDGSSRKWHEYTFVHYYFPGQTLYHDGLLVRKESGESIFFVGDSFTPTGIDDYCLLNRNFLERDKGYLYCLGLLRKLRIDWLINQHVEPMFRFTPAEYDRMTKNLTARTGLLAQLFPYDDPNYGTDEGWARLYPYQVEAAAGETVRLKFIITNHAPVERRYRVVPHPPQGWKGSASALNLRLGPGEEGVVEFPVTAGHGTGVVTADVSWEGWEFRHWAEALIIAP